MDGMHESEAGMMQYLQDQGLHHHISNGNEIDQDDHGDNNDMGSSDGVNEVMDGDVANMGNQANNHDTLTVISIPVGCNDNTNQLTLSFQGLVYVFDSVTPEKVQAALLLLGVREIPPNIPTVPVSTPNNRGLSSTPQKLNVPQRMASLIRFREKRKERNFDKKIRYTVRKEVALRMQRNKGQFTSSKPASDETASNWESTPSWGTDGNEPQVQDTRVTMDGMHESEAGMMQYQQDQGLHHHISNGNEIDQDDHGDNNNMGSSDGVNEVMDGDVANMGNQTNNHDTLTVIPIPVGCNDDMNQLTLSFQGQVYVFDSVSPEKVQVVLLLLGGPEIPPNIPTVPVSTPNNRGLSSTPQKLNVPQRMASLIRFREKRKERNFDKKIRYTVRKEVALSNSRFPVCFDTTGDTR